MELRHDLQAVHPLISRLISIGVEFQRNDKQWSHLKNNEDFDRVLHLEDSREKAIAQRVYGDGRDMALFMSSELGAINYDFTKYPTLTHIINRFDNTWIYSNQNKSLEESKRAFSSLNLNNWAYDQMTILFEDQISLLQAVKATLLTLKNTELYKIENGIPVTNPQTLTFNNISNSNIALNSDNNSQIINHNDHFFSKLIQTADNLPIENKTTLIESIKNMETESKTGSIQKSYIKFIEIAASHMTVFAPFIPALTALLK